MPLRRSLKCQLVNPFSLRPRFRLLQHRQLLFVSLPMVSASTLREWHSQQFQLPGMQASGSCEMVPTLSPAQATTNASVPVKPIKTSSSVSIPNPTDRSSTTPVSLSTVVSHLQLKQLLTPVQSTRSSIKWRWPSLCCKRPWPRRILVYPTPSKGQNFLLMKYICRGKTYQGVCATLSNFNFSNEEQLGPK